jgi:hypothetical protein
VKPFDIGVILESILAHADLQGDGEALVTIMLDVFYVRFFGGRAYSIRGDA